MIFFLAFLLLLILALILVALWCHRGPIGGSGGLPFPGEVVIRVPHFCQADPRWRDELLGNTPGTLGAEGCAVASAAMVLSHYGMDVDPGRLNLFLARNNGYEGRGWLKWEAAAEYSPGLVEKAYEDLPSYALVDWNLLWGNPVIVRVRLSSGVTHFVVIAGKRGFGYLIHDPLKASDALDPMAELRVPAEALRYYRKTLPK